MSLNIRRFLGKEQKKTVDTRVGRQELTPEERKARERKYSEGISEMYNRGMCGGNAGLGAAEPEPPFIYGSLSIDLCRY